MHLIFSIIRQLRVFIQTNFLSLSPATQGALVCLWVLAKG